MRVLWFICVLFQAGNLLALSGERPPEVDDAPLRVRRAPQQGYLVEMVVVVDQNEAAKFQNDRAAIEANVRALLGYVNRFYSTFNLEVSLLRLEILTSNSVIPINEYSAHNTIDLFISYVSKMKSETADNSDWNRADNFQLLLGNSFQRSYGYRDSSGYSGMARPSSMCSTSSAALVVNFSDQAFFEASKVLAHELGHNLGLPDINTGCSAQTCIMQGSSYTSNTEPEWSSYSKNRLRGFLPTYDCIKRGSSKENRQKKTDRNRNQDRIGSDKERINRESQEKLKEWYRLHPGATSTATRTRGRTHPTTTVGPVDSRHENGLCTDISGRQLCEDWKSMGYCTYNKPTQTNCQLTCGLCGGNGRSSSRPRKPQRPRNRDGLCTDISGRQLCEDWKSMGYCTYNKPTQTNCQLTCGLCG